MIRPFLSDVPLFHRSNRCRQMDRVHPEAPRPSLNMLPSCFNRCVDRSSAAVDQVHWICSVIALQSNCSCSAAVAQIVQGLPEIAASNGTGIALKSPPEMIFNCPAEQLQLLSCSCSNRSRFSRNCCLKCRLTALELL